MKKLTLIILVNAICLISNSQNSLDTLNAIYSRNDTIALLHFIDNWAKESDSLRNTVRTTNDTIKDVYSVYKEFYCPTKWRKIGKSEWKKSFYKKTKHIIVQTEIKYSICFSYNKIYDACDSCAEYSLLNFYPKISLKNKTTLYLTPAYDTLINKFLGNEQYDVGAKSIMNPAYAKGESAKRQEFLNKYLQIIHGHWNGWIINSDPYASIVFNKTFNNCDINFVLIYEGGVAKFHKHHKKWRKVNSKLTWIT